MTNDYRNTEYCPAYENIGKKKQDLKRKILVASPKTHNFYNKISPRKDPYHKSFAEIYNCKCAYCGAKWGELPTSFFEIDHFIQKSAYPDTTEGRAAAGQIENLIWSCYECNRGKSDLLITAPYDTVLNPDDGSITNIFCRGEDYTIRIRDKYQSDSFIRAFYKALGLDRESKRLDYLILKLKGKIERETDAQRKLKLYEALNILQENRNTYT